MAASMKMTVFWDIALCNLIKVDRRFKGAYCHHHQSNKKAVYWFFACGFLITLMMDAASTSETSIYFNETTYHYIPEAVIVHMFSAHNRNMSGISRDFMLANIHPTASNWISMQHFILVYTNIIVNSQTLNTHTYVHTFVCTYLHTHARTCTHTHIYTGTWKY
jgi:hypothetical protein